MGVRPAKSPDWAHLYEMASAQDAYFTVQQAAEAGYSPQLLQKHIRAGRISRTRRGIYRLVHYPAGDHEELAILWLWSERAGVFSHQTALSLHGLSDVLPGHIHLTLPSEWRTRRLRVPKGVVVHHADLPPADRTWFGAVPATSPRRTLVDCTTESISPEVLRQAAQQALRRGLVARGELAEVEQALTPFGGLADDERLQSVRSPP